MNLAKNTLAALTIFGACLLFGSITTAKSLELGTQPFIEKASGTATYPYPPTLPQFRTPKLDQVAE